MQRIYTRKITVKLTIGEFEQLDNARSLVPFWRNRSISGFVRKAILEKLQTIAKAKELAGRGSDKSPAKTAAGSSTRPRRR